MTTGVGGGTGTIKAVAPAGKAAKEEPAARRPAAPSHPGGGRPAALRARAWRRWSAAKTFLPDFSRSGAKLIYEIRLPIARTIHKTT